MATDGKGGIVRAIDQSTVHPICSSSKLSVTTCERDHPVGWKLEYDHLIKLMNQIKYLVFLLKNIARNNGESGKPIFHRTCSSQRIYKKSKTRIFKK